MNRRRLRCAAIVAATSLGAAACSGDREAARSPSSTRSPASSAPSSPAPAPTATSGEPAEYKAVDKPCEAVDASAVEPLVGTPRGQEENASPGGVLTVMTCRLRYADHVVTVQVDLFENLSGEAMYQGLRGVQEDQSKVTDVPGVGTAAYFYDDPATGPHVVAYDGNLHISVGLAPLTAGSGTAPVDVSKNLGEVATATMTELRAR